jgi:hypothetical protein
MNRRCFLILLALLCACAGQSAEPSPVPKKLRADIGSFYGPWYYVELRGSTLYYFEENRLIENKQPVWKRVVAATFTPTPAEWRKFRESIEKAGVWRWKADYADNPIGDGIVWSLEIEYSDQSIKANGSNDYPNEKGAPLPKAGGPYTPAFLGLLEAVQKLVGGRKFQK